MFVFAGDFGSETQVEFGHLGIFFEYIEMRRRKTQFMECDFIN